MGTQGGSSNVEGTANANPAVTANQQSVSLDQFLRLVKSADRRTLNPLLAVAEPEWIRAAVDAAIEIDRVDENGKTPLGCVIMFREKPELVKALVDAGADLHRRDQDGGTPLFDAVLCSTPQMVRALIAAGSDLYARNNEGWTPLIVAAQRRGADVVELLASVYPRIDERDPADMTPLMYAAGMNTDPGVLVALLKAGADPRAKNKNNMTPALFARDNPNPRVIQAFVEYMQQDAQKRASERTSKSGCLTAIVFAGPALIALMYRALKA